MDHIRRVMNFVVYNAEEEFVPAVEPYAFEEGPFAGETVRTLMQKGLDGLYILKTILVRSFKINDFDCANSIVYELRNEARKILETCDDDSYDRYLCALFELFDAMPFRSGYCADFIREYYDEEEFENESTYDFIYFDEPDDHYYVLDKIITDIEKFPIFVYQTECIQNHDVLNDGKYGVFPGNYVAVVKKADQETGKLTKGIVAEVLTKSTVHPRGIKVRLENGTIGRVQSFLN